MPLQIAYSYLSGGVFILVETDDASRQHEIHVGPLLLSTQAIIGATLYVTTVTCHRHF